MLVWSVAETTVTVEFKFAEPVRFAKNLFNFMVALNCSLLRQVEVFLGFCFEADYLEVVTLIAIIS